MSDYQYDAMVAGHLCLDITPRFPEQGTRDLAEILVPGRLVHMAEAALGTGGGVSNTGLAMQRLGNRVGFCARVGDDDFGRLTRARLGTAEQTAAIRSAPGSNSSYTVALAPPGIDRILLHNPGANDDFGPEDLDPRLIAQCRLFHFGYPPLMARMYSDGGDTLCEVFRIAKEAGATTSCDMALPDPASPAGQADWRGILEKSLPYIDIFLPSFEEAFFMLDREGCQAVRTEHGGIDLVEVADTATVRRLADELLALGPGIVGLKLGHRGWYVRTEGGDGFAAFGAARPGDADAWAGRELWAAACVIDSIQSATGAGDASIAGFLSAFLAGEAIEDALRWAACLGWQNLQALDATSGIRDRDETARLVAAGMATADPGIAAEGWRESTPGVWSGKADRTR